MHASSLFSIFVSILCVHAKKPEKAPRRHLQGNEESAKVANAPFRPAHRNQDDDSLISSTTSEEDDYDDIEAGGHDSDEGFVCRWWNWLFGGKSCRSSRKQTRRPERKKRVREWRNEEVFEFPGQNTVTLTVTVTMTGAPVDEQMKQQNARRQAAFNDWFNQDDVKRSAKKVEGE